MIILLNKKEIPKFFMILYAISPFWLRTDFYNKKPNIETR